MANSRTKADARHRVNVCLYRGSRSYIDIKIETFHGGGNGQLFEKTRRRRREDRAKDVSGSVCVWLSILVLPGQLVDSFFSSTLFTSSTPLKDGIVTES